MKPRVVFVDDEPDVLAGMRDRLRRHRRKWDMVFHTSPHAALSDLAASGADVVITDVRMPGLDGAELLAWVRTHLRGATRVALSGQADAATAIRVLAVSHQFLGKPCDMERVVEIIERRQRLASLMPAAALAFVSSARELGAQPETHRELAAVLARDRWSPTDAAAILESDAVASVHLFRAAASPYFDAPPSATLDQVVSSLGPSTVSAIVEGLVTHGVFSQRSGRYDTRRLTHTRRSLAAARRMAELLPHRAADAYLAGLTHDLGTLVIANAAADELATIEREAASRRVCRSQLQRERLGFTHAHAGAALLALWGLPCDVVEAVLLQEQSGGGELALALRTTLGAEQASPMWAQGGRV